MFNRIAVNHENVEIRGVRRAMAFTSVVSVLASLVTGCGGKSEPSLMQQVPVTSSASGGQGGNATTSATTGVTGGTSECNVASTDPSALVVHLLDLSPIEVACRASFDQNVLSVDAARDRCLNWQASVTSADGVLTASRTSGSMCPGFGSFTVGVTAKFPDDATPGATATGTLVVTTDHPGLRCVSVAVSAVVVQSQFAIDATALIFGNVASGSTATLIATVTNLGAGPLPAIVPESLVPAPFSYRDWGIHAEDPAPTNPLMAGATTQIFFSCTPTTSGDDVARITLSPCPGAPAACSNVQTIDLSCSHVQGIN